MFFHTGVYGIPLIRQEKIILDTKLQFALLIHRSAVPRIRLRMAPHGEGKESASFSPLNPNFMYIPYLVASQMIRMARMMAAQSPPTTPPTKQLERFRYAL